MGSLDFLNGEITSNMVFPHVTCGCDTSEDVEKIVFVTAPDSLGRIVAYRHAMRHLVGAATSLLARVLPIRVHNFLILDPDRLHATGRTRLVPTPSSSPQGILLLACACLPVPAGAALGLPPPWAIPWFLFAIAKTFGAVNDIIGVSILFPPPHYPLSPLSRLHWSHSERKDTRQKHQTIANTVACQAAVVFAVHGAISCGIPSVPGRTPPRKKHTGDGLGFFS